MLTIVLAIALLAAAAMAWLRRAAETSAKFRILGRLPGPPGWPLLGNALMFARHQRDLATALNKIHAEYVKYDSPMIFWLGPTPYVAIHRPHHVQTVMTSPHSVDKGDVYEILADVIGYGLIQANGARHKAHRKIIGVSFKPQVLEEHTAILDAKGRECVLLMEKHIDGGTFEVSKIVELSSMAAVSEVIMGIKMDGDDPNNHKILDSINTVYKTLNERMYKFWLHPKFIFKLSSCYRRQKPALDMACEFIESAINIKEKELKTSRNGEHESVKHRIALEWLLQVRDEKDRPMFSREMIKEELITLFTAAQDTTMTIISFTLLMLAIHKDVQERVLAEQENIFGPGNKSEPVQSEHLKDMHYLHMVIQEVMRHYPIAPAMVRKLSNELKIGEFTIPKDTQILINAYCMHMDENIWPEPNKFDPLRFLPEERAKRHPYSHIPFSGGVRGCLGKIFALNTIKCFVSHIVRNYALNSDWTMEDVKTEIDISVRSTNGYKLSIKRRI